MTDDTTQKTLDALSRLRDAVEERRPDLLDLWQRLAEMGALPLFEALDATDAELLILSLKYTVASTSVSELLRLQAAIDEENRRRKAAAPWN